jgi:hypothetical protein
MEWTRSQILQIRPQAGDRYEKSFLAPAVNDSRIEHVADDQVAESYNAVQKKRNGTQPLSH